MTVHEIDEAEGKTFISMAYVEGESLREKNKSGPLKLNEALAIILQVAEGLEDAHKKGIVHRDIKSASIMVDKKGQAKIMDFGLAKVAGGTLITREARTMGTAITQALQLKLTGEEKRRLTKRYTEDTEAYQLLLKGRYLLNRRTPKGMKKSIVWIYASLGEKDKAFEWLQKAYDQRDFFIHQMKVEPGYDPLRSDPRFQDLMHRMNFPE